MIGLITVLIYVAVVATSFFALFELFASGDLSGLAKALWLFAIVFVPVFGVLAYFVLRPRWQPSSRGGAPPPPAPTPPTFTAGTTRPSPARFRRSPSFVRKVRSRTRSLTASRNAPLPDIRS
jgi:hypothetical protein